MKAEEIITSGPEVEFDPGTASDRAFRESAALVPGGDDAAVRSVDRAAALLVSLGDADGAAVRHMVGRIMWDGCGLERDADGLADAAGRLDALPMPADAESAGLLEVARLVVAAAAAREESRGAHFRSDFPDSDPTLARRTCWAGDTPAAMPSIDLTEAA